MALSTSPDIADLIADTEAEILRLVEGHGSGDRRRCTRCPLPPGPRRLRPTGKRMRPLLGLLAYASITGDHRHALPGAAAVELGHNFSLVHDDIEDDDRERRHRPTLWTLHGIPQAINTGDTLFSLSRIALHRLTDLGFPDAKVLRLMRLYDQTCLALCEGQYLDIWMAEHDDGLSVELYFDMIGRKTAALIAALDRGGRDPRHGRRGRHRPLPRASAGPWASRSSSTTTCSGIWGAEQATGKEPSDLATHKKTLPVIYAFEHAGPEDRARLGELYANGRPRGRDIDRDRGDPGADRRPRLHPRPGPPLPRRGDRRAGRAGASSPRPRERLRRSSSRPSAPKPLGAHALGQR